ncbi:MAG: FAD-dependent thymidylate synthase [Acidimicrobiales bacterium]
MNPYAEEQFSVEESDILRRYFTNLDLPVFALVNLPEVVKGALFARYSRSAKSLRRLFLDEFVGDLDITGDITVDATVGVARAEQLYERVFLEFGDDSVAQLGGVHLACEQASNILTKVLEWGRLMSYLEQSTRYIAYDSRLSTGRYRYYRDSDVLSSAMGTRYVGDMDRMFDTYARLLPVMSGYFAESFPKDPQDSDFVHRQSIKAKALDSLRGLLPAASLSNLGIYGNGQSYEALLVRMRGHPLPEVRLYGEMMLVELRKVIPSFLRRVDLHDRGTAHTRYLRDQAAAMAEVAQELIGEPWASREANVELVDFDPDGEAKVVTAALYPHSAMPEGRLMELVHGLTPDQRARVLVAYAGERTNRRHRPGRALEATSYRFDVVSDYGAFRDLQRHRMMTIQWQPLSIAHGYGIPEAVAQAGLAGEFEECMTRSAALYEALLPDFPEQAPYAVSLAYRIRYSMDMTARQALHLIELRSGPQGHPAYRAVAQEMHRLIGEKAGHSAIAAMMSFVDHSEPTLERLEAERQAEIRRTVARPGPRL